MSRLPNANPADDIAQGFFLSFIIYAPSYYQLAVTRLLQIITILDIPYLIVLIRK